MPSTTAPDGIRTWRDPFWVRCVLGYAAAVALLEISRPVFGSTSQIARHGLASRRRVSLSKESLTCNLAPATLPLSACFLFGSAPTRV
jgi:hypothetical protein